MRQHVKTVLIALLTIGLLGFFLRQANLGQVWTEIGQARIDLLALAVAATIATYLVRAWRWQYLLQPIGAARFGVAFRTTVVGFAVNFVLPARPGELLRPYLLARRERLSATSSFATIILERLLDLLTVLMLLGAYLLLFDPGLAVIDPRVFEAVRVGGLLVAGGAVLAAIMAFALAGHPERLGEAAQRMDDLLPARVAGVLASLVRTFVRGLAVMRQPARLLVALALSLPLWLCIAFEIWLVSVAFGIDLPFTGSFLITALLAVGVSVPTPGAVGGFHLAYQVGVTTFFGAPIDTAVGAALVLHAVSVVPVVLLGAIFMAQEGLSLSRIRGMASAEAPLAGAPVPESEGPEDGMARAEPAG